MKTRTYRVQPHVRKQKAQNYRRETTSADAIKFFNQLVTMARQEIRLAKRVSVTGSAYRRDANTVTFQSEFGVISLNFREGVAV